jgi:sulfite exporter TauE/SafE
VASKVKNASWSTLFLTEPLAWVAGLCSAGAGAAYGGSLLIGLFLAGLAGSAVHCAPMCGPFVLGQVSDRLARVPAARLCEASRLSAALLLPYHCGRLIVYSMLGAGAAVAGLAFGALVWFDRLSAVLLLLAALLFVGNAARRLSFASLGRLGWLERAPPGWGRRVAALTRRIDRTHWSGGLQLGLTLGFLPCGFLYAALAVAATTGQPAGGALAMLGFGLGTVPSLVVVGLAGQAAGRRWHRVVTALAPAVMLANAALLVAMAWVRAAGSM